MANSSNSDERVGWELIWRGEVIPPRYQSLAAPSPAVVEWADTLAAGSFVLDIGCGVGRHLIYLGERGFRVAGMDISPSGIRKSQEVCAERNITLDGKVGDMNNLPWADGTFDGVYSIATIHHHLRAGIVKTMSEVKRVLKSGGLFLADFPCIDSVDYQELRSQVAAGTLSEVEPNTFVDERPNLDDMNDAFLPHRYFDEADLRDLLGEFEIIKLETTMRNPTAKPGVTGNNRKWVAWARKPLTNG
jgi:tellurite methyltransferase